MFKDAVGPPPLNQGFVDQLFKEGEARYKIDHPPGYEDKTKTGEFSYGGITYKEKFGDLIIWKQIISHAAEHSFKNIIFVTDDKKEDWWWKIEGKRNKTIGVRPELRDEISREASVSNFHIYSTESFLSYAKKHLNLRVTKEAIDEVREVSDDQHSSTLDLFGSNDPIKDIPTEVIYEWLSSQNSHLKIEDAPKEASELSFVGSFEEEQHGFAIYHVFDSRKFYPLLKRRVKDLQFLGGAMSLSHLTIILAVTDRVAAKQLENQIHSLLARIRWDIKLIIGEVDFGSASEEDYKNDTLIPSNFIQYSAFQL